MNKYISVLAAFSLFAFGMSASANSTCKQIETQCENALELKKALSPYFQMGVDGAIGVYTSAHDFVEKQVPQQLFEYTAPYASDATVSNYLAHASVVLGTVVVAQGLKAMTAIPMAMLKMPFSNRATMFLSGVVAKSIYDSYNQKKQEK